MVLEVQNRFVDQSSPAEQIESGDDYDPVDLVSGPIHELISEIEVETPSEHVWEYNEVPTRIDDTVILPAFYNNRFILLMTVRGRQMQGLIVDPGAAKGVIGSDTLEGIKDRVLTQWRLLKHIEWKPSNARFSGISSAQETSLGVCGIPIGLQGVPNSMFFSDVLGGSASQCPGLVPLHSLMSNAEFMHFAFFNNGDGVLGVRHRGGIAPQRLHLTDSGHYLLRVDLFGVPIDRGLNEAIANRLYNQLMNPSLSHSSGSRHASPRRNRESVALPVFVEDWKTTEFQPEFVDDEESETPHEDSVFQ